MDQLQAFEDSGKVEGTHVVAEGVLHGRGH